jgi:NAD-specific glutamate dehydrogenase
VLANDIINLGGTTFAFRAIEETTGSAAALARAFVAVREAFDLHWIAEWMAGLPPAVPAEHAAELAPYVRRMLDRATRWYMTHDHEPIEHIADLYSTAFQRMGALKLLLRITDLPVQNRWETLARAALRDDVYSAVADMTISVLRTTSSSGPERAGSTERIVEWERGHQEQLARIKDTFAEVTQPGPVDIHSISVALKLLRTLVRN